MTGVQTCGLPISRRVRLSREKGWRMPENTVKVDRTSKWGNPHKGTRTEAAAAYTRDIQDLHSAGSLGLHMLDELRHDLRGKNLDCWRSDEHTSELQSLMRSSYAVFCLKSPTNTKENQRVTTTP